LPFLEIRGIFYTHFISPKIPLYSCGNTCNKTGFDILDLPAIAFGTVIAYFVLLTTSKMKEIT
jgi:hypothetical protein